jgi:hypothetical protein
MESFESTAPDPYVVAGRPEHTPDCIGDYIGLSQKKWTQLGGECDGNIDGSAFVFWDKSGGRRDNYVQTNASGQWIHDIPSGLRAWARSRGYDADVFTQLAAFNPEKTGPGGWTYTDVKSEIDAGYPLLCFLQPMAQYSRTLTNPVAMPSANPDTHAVVIYGYVDDPANGITESVLLRTSWGPQLVDPSFGVQPWRSTNWLTLFPVRGVIGFRPKPKITGVQRENERVTVRWDGPAASLVDALTGDVRPAHWYQLERSFTLSPSHFEPVGSPTAEHAMVVAECCAATAFYRIKLLAP